MDTKTLPILRNFLENYKLPFDFRLGDKVVLDADVLIGFPACDTFLTFGDMGVITPIWSAEILDEVKRNLIHKLNQPVDKMENRIIIMKEAFPNAETLISDVLINRMPNHPKDRHVLAAAVTSGAKTLITFNIKDFKQAETLGLLFTSQTNF